MHGSCCMRTIARRISPSPATAVEIVYIQDKGGDEMYDIYALPLAGGEPRNLTNTDQTTETGPIFSRDGSMLAFDAKDKTSPSTNIAVMAWPSRTRPFVDSRERSKSFVEGSLLESRWQRSLC